MYIRSRQKVWFWKADDKTITASTILPSTENAILTNNSVKNTPIKTEAMCSPFQRIPTIASQDHNENPTHFYHRCCPTSRLEWSSSFDDSISTIIASTEGAKHSIVVNKTAMRNNDNTENMMLSCSKISGARICDPREEGTADARSPRPWLLPRPRRPCYPIAIDDKTEGWTDNTCIRTSYLPQRQTPKLLLVGYRLISAHRWRHHHHHHIIPTIRNTKKHREYLVTQ